MAAVPATRDYYEVLGVSRDADSETIRSAFRDRAHALHPHVSSDADAAASFRDLSEAYGVLSKSSSRLLYDHFGYAGGGNGSFPPEGAQAAADLPGERAAPVAEVVVDEQEARRGVSRTVGWPGTEQCDACEGEGAAPGAISMVCPACEATGRRSVESSLPDDDDLGLLHIDECPACQGRGRLVSEACPGCDGAGVTRVWETADVGVPPGAVDGQLLPLDERSRDVALVRVLAAPPERSFVRYVAAVGLLVALVFLWLLLR